MEGIGLDNMLGAEEVEKLFSDQVEQPQEQAAQEAPKTGDETPVASENSETTTAEVDFSEFIGNQSESVGSEETSEGNRETPKSNSDSGTPQINLFSSIAKALRDEGVFPDLSDDTLNEIKDADGFRKLFDDEVSKSLDERQKRLEKALNSGATSEEMQQYQSALTTSQFLEARDTYDLLLDESDKGEQLRKQVMYQDYINRGFSDDRAKKMVQKSIDDGSDIDDAKEAFNSCKDFYRNRVESYQQEMDDRQRRIKENEEKQYSSLKKRMLETEDFFDGVKVDKGIRQKAYDSITKPVYKDEQGNYLTALQQYQREHPMEFMENVAMMYSLTDGFKNVERLTKNKVKAGLKKGFAELESVLNSSRRNGDGTLNLANSGPDDSEREKWTLAL